MKLKHGKPASLFKPPTPPLLNHHCSNPFIWFFHHLSCFPTMFELFLLFETNKPLPEREM